MRKLLCALLGLILTLPVFAGECNLFDRDTMGTVQSVSLANTNGDNKIFYNSGSNSIVMPCEPNVNYTISFGGNFEGSMFRVATTERLVTSADGASNPYTPITIVRQTTGDPITINSGANAHYLYIQVSALVFQSMVNILQVETGTTATTFKRYDASCHATCPNGGTLQTYTSATGTVTQNGTPSPTNPIEPIFYQQGNMVLRKVGDVADSYDATTGKITRRVGVKVFDGTGDWTRSNTYANAGVYASMTEITDRNFNQRFGLSTHFINTNTTSELEQVGYMFLGASTQKINFAINKNSTLQDWTQFLADQYNAGTPVTVYYPLETPVEEDWAAEQCTSSSPIKIATTAYNSARFSPVVTELNNTIATIRSVVTNTINQTKAIADLQATKQTRPDENCPAGKKCLLVEDDAGQPHWYEIVESAD